MFERTAEEVSFEWLLHGFLYKDLKVRIGLLKNTIILFVVTFVANVCTSIVFNFVPREIEHNDYAKF